MSVLTETGGGTPMALYDGISADTTEILAGEWCGDLLQIVDELPEAYQLIDCCFAPIWDRANYCYQNFGVDENDYLLNDSNGNLYTVTRLGFRGERGETSNLKVEVTDDKIRYFVPPKEEKKTAEKMDIEKLLQELLKKD